MALSKLQEERPLSHFLQCLTTQLQKYKILGEHHFVFKMLEHTLLHSSLTERTSGCSLNKLFFSLSPLLFLLFVAE